jgi:hypothetical protein
MKIFECNGNIRFHMTSNMTIINQVIYGDIQINMLSYMIFF